MIPSPSPSLTHCLSLSSKPTRTQVTLLNLPLSHFIHIEEDDEDEDEGGRTVLQTETKFSVKSFYFESAQKLSRFRSTTFWTGGSNLQKNNNNNGEDIKNKQMVWKQIKLIWMHWNTIYNIYIIVLDFYSDKHCGGRGSPLLSRFVCTYHPVVPGSNLKQTIYAL